jgi:hypothetical protein
MGHRPSKKHTIERKNNNKGYSPSNCIWALISVQSVNRRNNVFLEVEGRRLTQSQWEKELKLNEGRLSYMRWLGKSDSQLIEFLKKRIK